jgi:CDP-glucose 4,6-dehydratase
MSLQSTFSSRRVLVTGHTGFKGSWLCEWLLNLGAEVHGLALAPDSDQKLFDQLDLGSRLQSDNRADIFHLSSLQEILRSVSPDFVFHLAAQPLVRRSYRQPVETFSTNLMGTVNMLEALRHLDHPCVAIMVTTDKCYENREWLHSYREEDPMGGHDPYSASKGCAELAIKSYQRSYFFQNETISVASGRAGNVIGGGDWAEDRIVPDAIRALQQGLPIEVRNPHATRPWQHVLEPLGGYLCLAQHMALARKENNLPKLSKLQSGFNFGPALSSNQPVSTLIQLILQFWPGEWKDLSDPRALHEASLLNLATDKAFHLLDWKPRWDFEQTVARTVTWYRNQTNLTPRQRVLEDITEYMNSSEITK